MGGREGLQLSGIGFRAGIYLLRVCISIQAQQTNMCGVGLLSYRYCCVVYVQCWVHGAVTRAAGRTRATVCIPACLPKQTQAGNEWAVIPRGSPRSVMTLSAAAVAKKTPSAHLPPWDERYTLATPLLFTFFCSIIYFLDISSSSTLERSSSGSAGDSHNSYNYSQSDKRLA